MVQLLIPAAFLANRGHWWGFVLPLLGWLPGELLPVVAAIGMTAPLFTRRSPEPEPEPEPVPVAA
jgi:hypothetical protein